VHTKYFAIENGTDRELSEASEQPLVNVDGKVTKAFLAKSV
jgi:hypothetical protein